MQGILIQKACLKNLPILTVINPIKQTVSYSFQISVYCHLFSFTLNSKM
jgi:hypothetical protein